MYFGDLASRYSTRKQGITFASFFLSSSAAAKLIAKLPAWVAIILALSVAAMTAYSVAISLDSKIRTVSKLHYAWNQLGGEYYWLWNHTFSDSADSDFHDLMRREHDLSEIATTDAPNNEALLAHWQDQVFKLHHLTNA
jgi:hypothetical protein